MLGWDGALPLPSVRTIEEMRSVLADPSCESSGHLYYMYRDLAKVGCRLAAGYTTTTCVTT